MRKPYPGAWPTRIIAPRRRHVRGGGVLPRRALHHHTPRPLQPPHQPIADPRHQPPRPDNGAFVSLLLPFRRAVRGRIKNADSPSLCPCRRSVIRRPERTGAPPDGRKLLPHCYPTSQPTRYTPLAGTVQEHSGVVRGCSGMGRGSIRDSIWDSIRQMPHRKPLIYMDDPTRPEFRVFSTAFP